MSEIKSVRDVIAQVVLGTATQRENAIALHDYVREEIKFGFNKYFDASPPDYTLACGYGHCNPKSRLMVALFRAMGLDAFQHFVVISKEILKGTIPSNRYWMIGAEVSHSYVEINIEGTWCKIDSFIVDTALLKGARAKLAQEGSSLGYGVRLNSVNVWDGTSNAFSQFDQSMMVEDHGRIDDLDAYFRSKKYRNVAFGMSFNRLFKFMGEAGVAPMNTNIDSIRRYG